MIRIEIIEDFADEDYYLEVATLKSHVVLKITNDDKKSLITLDKKGVRELVETLYRSLKEID